MALRPLFPTFDPATQKLVDGAMVRATPFCRRQLAAGDGCSDFYRQILSQAEGYHQCPFGFSTRSVMGAGQAIAVTGVVAHPRFGGDMERQRAKDYPNARVARETIETVVGWTKELEKASADAVEAASSVLPQAFHELRKLNGAIIQHAERELQTTQSAALQTIRSAAELMRNNFDILEALSNIEGMRALPLDDSINLFDLAYKTKKVFEERANSRGMTVLVEGVRALAPGSRKSFPIVPAVLIENAIKYGPKGSTIVVEIAARDDRAVMTVDNLSDCPIDPERCFQRGSRFAASVAEGGGFGLFLAREIVDAHNGRIACIPRSGKVTFSVELPLAKVVPSGW